MLDEILNWQTKNENFVPVNFKSGNPWPMDKSVRSVQIFTGCNPDKMEIFVKVISELSVQKSWSIVFKS